ncbi:MAG: site-specific integrase [Dehalococcoidia bacterium]|nr:site-specific integrase [Dehalococcoidia bacterium]
MSNQSASESGGSFKRLASGHWQLRFRMRESDGRTVQRAVSAPTKRECNEKRDALKLRFAGLAAEARRDLTLNKWMAEWLAWSRESGSIQLTTLDHYVENHERYIRASIGELKLIDITPALVQRWLASTEASNAMRRKMLATLRAALTRAVRLELIRDNPAAAERLDVPVHTPKPQPHLEHDEVGRLLNVLLAVVYRERTRSVDGVPVELLDEPTFRRLTDLQHQGEVLVPLLGLTTGLRPGELRALSWENVDLENGRLLVAWSACTVRDVDKAPVVHTNRQVIRPRKLLRKAPKSASGRRWVGLLPAVVDALTNERARQQALNWEPTALGDLVCRNRYGGPLSEKSISGRVTRFLEAAGIARRGYYALRHTFASVAVQSGEGDFSIADMMGHSDPAFTKRTYVHMFEAQREARAERLAAEFVAYVLPISVKSAD